VQRAVRSALAQDYADLEVVVVIDGPDGATEEVLAEISDDRLRVLGLPRQVGAARARNLGVAAARADWIAFLDDDDEWFREKTTLQMREALNSRYRYPIVSSRLIARNSQYDLVWPRSLPSKPLSEYLLSRKGWSYGEGLLSTTTLLFPKDLYRQVPFQADLARHQDLEWVLRATEHAGAGLEFVPEPLAVWNLAEQRKSISTSADWRSSFRWLESVREMITRRAYAGFIATYLAPQASRQRAWRDFPFLVKRLIADGAPSAHDILLFLGMWLVPPGARRWIRQEGR
jgi:glycosyltransferase involved in cell wall biosynthesis